MDKRTGVWECVSLCVLTYAGDGGDCESHGDDWN